MKRLLVLTVAVAIIASGIFLAPSKTKAQDGSGILEALYAEGAVLSVAIVDNGEVVDYTPIIFVGGTSDYAVATTYGSFVYVPEGNTELAYETEGFSTDGMWVTSEAAERLRCDGQPCNYLRIPVQVVEEEVEEQEQQLLICEERASIFCSCYLGGEDCEDIFNLELDRTVEIYGPGGLRVGGNCNDEEGKGC